MEPAINISRAIRDGWLSTHVGSYIIDHNRPEDTIHQFLKPRKFISGHCMSAATLIFLGGRLRYVDNDSKFGVHQFSFKNPSPGTLSKSQILSSKIACLVADMDIDPRFLEISSSVDDKEIKILTNEDLTKLRIVTGGQTDVVWTVQSRSNVIYLRGERDSIYGHHKMILGFEKLTGFFVHAVIESQGREEELTTMPLVELVVGQSEKRIIDISSRVERSVIGIYTNIATRITADEAIEISASDGFGLRLRWTNKADIFLGIAPMDTKSGSDEIHSFVHIFT